MIEGRPVVIVNPVSSGAELAPAFAERKVPAVAVRLTAAGKKGAGFATQIREEDFVAIYDLQPDLTDQLRKINPQAIIAGSEAAVALADELAAELTPRFANAAHLARARIHKAAMQQALAAAGLPFIPTLNAANADEVQPWLVKNNLTNSALVIKPPASAGSDSVFHVAAGGDWLTPFQQILNNKAKLLGRLNETVIVQEQVSGVEFGVDTVSANGTHELAHLTRYQKTKAGDRATVFDYTEFVPLNPAEHSAMMAYTHKVLDALGIRWGAAHNEIMLTAKGPRLIETGARMCGGPVLEFSRAATGSSQLERVVEAYLDGHISTPSYRVRQTVVPVFLAAPISGILKNVEVLDQLTHLPTHLTTKMWHANGDHVRHTVDFDTTMGIVALAGDREAVFADYVTVREVEAQIIIEPSD